MPPMELEQAIPASERPETHVLDRTATAIDNIHILTKDLTVEKFQRMVINILLLYVDQT
jgi:hypothetical protein